MGATSAPGGALPRAQAPARVPRRGRRPAAVLWLTFALAWGPSAEDPEPSPPNVIVISIDTLRRDHVGSCGYERDTTPRLDELSEESIVFDRAYTTWSWTLPAHMSLLTGLYPSQHGIWRVGAVLPDSLPTLAERLSPEGYHCIGLHFPGWLDPEYGFGRGFDVYRSHRNAEEATAHLREALATRPPEAPLFLFVHLFDVHNAPLPRVGSPYRPPPPFDELFLEGAPQRLSELPGREIWKKDGSSVTPEQHEAIVALYDGGIRYVDEVVGAWFDEWRGAGLLDRSLVIVTSDHGEGLYQRGGRYGGHGEGYEEGMRVPLLVRLPGAREAGTRRDHPVTLVDLVPTVLEILDLPQDPRLPGRDLREPRKAGEIIVAENPRTEAEMILAWPRKVVRVPRAGQERYDDLSRDPGERDPVHAAEQPDLFERMATPLLRRAARERALWDVKVLDRAEGEPAEELPEDLRALGYGGDDQ